MTALIVQKEIIADDTCYENQEVWMFEDGAYKIEEEWHRAKGKDKTLKLIDFMESKGGKLVDFTEFVL